MQEPEAVGVNRAYKAVIQAIQEFGPKAVRDAVLNTGLQLVSGSFVERKGYDFCRQGTIGEQVRYALRDDLRLSGAGRGNDLKVSASVAYSSERAIRQDWWHWHENLQIARANSIVASISVGATGSTGSPVNSSPPVAIGLSLHLGGGESSTQNYGRLLRRLRGRFGTSTRSSLPRPASGPPVSRTCLGDMAIVSCRGPQTATPP